MSGVDIGGPYRRCQAIDGIVGNADGLLSGIEPDDRQHRPEDFLGGDAHLVVHPIKHRGLNKQAAGVFHDPLATFHQTGAFRLADANVVDNTIQLSLIHNGAAGRGRIQRMAGTPGFQCFSNQPDKFRANAVLDQQATAGGANFALVEGDGTGRLGSGFFQVWGIGKDNVGALAAGLQPYPLHVGLAGVNHQLFGHIRGPGKYQAIHVHVQGQSLAYGVTVARKHIENAGGDARLLGQSSHSNSAQGRFLGRF